MIQDAATDPKCILCGFRADVLLLLASSVFLVFSCKPLASILCFLVGSLEFQRVFLAAESGV